MIKPYQAGVIVKQDDIEEETTKSGLILAPTDKKTEKPNTGVILSKSEDIALSRGDRIMFAAYSGVEMKDNGEAVLFISEDNILAVL
jgi:chaperonin GroES